MAQIKVTDLEKRFGSKTVLHSISFAVQKGEFFAYIGPNGAGKTTTIRILLGVISECSGTAHIIDDNGNLMERNKIGFVLEDEKPFDTATPEEYLRFYADVYRISNRDEKISELLNMVGLEKQGRDKIAKFSKGMKRKLSVAKGLIAEPKILFLDEPFEGIEIEARREIKDILAKLQKDSIIFLTSHNLYEIEPLCTSFGIIIDGDFLGKWSQSDLKGKSLEDFYFAAKEQHQRGHTD
jgi:ABC-2 type transport system ATP-binding protein